MLYNLEIGSSYNFSLHANSILGNGFDRAKVVSIFDYDTAIQQFDVATTHASIYSLLPNNTPLNPALLIYVKIKTSSGENRILAMNWIASQPTLISSVNISVNINNVDLSKIDLLRASLNKLGFTNFTIDFNN